MKNVAMFSLSIFLIVLFFIYYLSYKQAEMKENEFTPIEFENVKLGYEEILGNICSPLYGKEIKVNTLLIKTPNKIVIRGIDSTKWVIPLCIRYSISLKRTLKYAKAPQDVIYIKNLQDNSVNSGRVYADISEGEFLFPDDYNKDMWKVEQEIINDAQKYKDEELDEGQFEEGFMNINLLRYINIQLLSGKYEVWFLCSGLESNHTIVKIVKGE